MEKIEEELKDLLSILPQGKAMVSYPIPQAIVRGIEEHFEGQKRICALEFLKLEKRAQQELTRHIFEKQRCLLRQEEKFGLSVPEMGPFQTWVILCSSSLNWIFI